jgi:hypothetical protein
VFRPADPLLSSQSAPPLYYLLARALTERTGDQPPPDRLRAFLDAFEARRRADLPPERRDPMVAEFARLARHSAYDRRSLERRLEILTARFLADAPRAIQRAG